MAEASSALPTAAGGAAAAAQWGLWDEAGDDFYHPRSLKSADYADGRGVLSVGGDMFTLTLSSGTPAPTGTDITNQAGGAIVGADLAIRNTAFHTFVVPMAGFRRIRLSFLSLPTFDQALSFQAYGVPNVADSNGSSLLVNATLPVATQASWGVLTGAGGQGSIVGGANIANNAIYAVPALDAPHPYVLFLFQASVAPSVGSVTAYIARSRS